MKYLTKSGPKISVNDMKNILTHDPFGVKEDGTALLLARFLVESQDEDTIPFDLNRTQDVGTIKNLFKKLVGSYALLEDEDERVMAEELSELLHNYEESLKTQLMMMPEAKSGYLSSDQIANAFELLEIEIEPSTLEYLIMNIYEYTGSLKRLDFMKMFEIFETEDHKKMKKLMEMYQQNEGDSERSDKKVKFKENKAYERPKSAGHNKQKLSKDDDDDDDYNDGEDEPYDEGEEEYEEDDYEDDFEEEYDEDFEEYKSDEDEENLNQQLESVDLRASDTFEDSLNFPKGKYFKKK